ASFPASAARIASAFGSDQVWSLRPTREGSLDSAIRAAVPNDLARLTALAPGLQAVAHNGGESARSRRLTERLGVDVHTLPSTSPANASWSFERKLAAWRDVFSRYDLAPSTAATP
ncbi:MAG TPA: hypothetical protein VIP05_03605, partial [Burkholderiaceae bacterium]